MVELFQKLAGEGQRSSKKDYEKKKTSGEGFRSLRQATKALPLDSANFRESLIKAFFALTPFCLAQFIVYIKKPNATNLKIKIIH